MFETVAKIVIPDYPDSLLVAKSRRAKYYQKGGKIPKRMAKNKQKYDFDAKGRLFNKESGELIIANPRTVGKERRWVVNFQDIWSGKMARSSRAARVNLLKDILRPFVQSHVVSRITSFPIGMEIHLYSGEQFKVDASNKGVIFTKIIEDLLVETQKIPDDSPEYITDTGRIVLHRTAGEKRMEVIIFKTHYT